MKIELKTYELKKEFLPLLNISCRVWDRRKEELLNWFKDYFDFEIIDNKKPFKILIKEIYGEYQPLPRKTYDVQKLTKEKIEDYKNFTIQALGTEFRPNSRCKIARDAIDMFGEDKYGHTSEAAVVRRYVKKPFDEYGETNDNKVWVNCITYKPLSEEHKAIWLSILAQEHIGADEAACAFYRAAQGEDISKEKGYFKKAIARFKDQYGYTPIMVKEWRVKTE